MKIFTENKPENTVVHENPVLKHGIWSGPLRIGLCVCVCRQCMQTKES